MNNTLTALAAGVIVIGISAGWTTRSMPGRALGEMTQQASPPLMKLTPGATTQQASPPLIKPTDTRPAVVPPEQTGGLRAGAPPGSRAGVIGLPAGTEEPAVVSEAEFLIMTGNSMRSQLRLAELAVGRTHDLQLKKLAESLVADYTASNEAFIRLTKTLRFKGPYARASQDLVYSRLHALNGTEFDIAFLHAVHQAQARDLRWSQAARAFASTQPLKPYLQKSEPVLQRRAERVEEFLASSSEDAQHIQLKESKMKGMAAAGVEGLH